MPLAGLGAEELQAASGSWTQRVGDVIADPCPSAVPAAGAPDARCAQAVQSLRRPVPGGLAIAAPPTLPSVDAPLGWTLSTDSRIRLTEAMADQVGICAGPRVLGYACLGDLLNVLLAR